MKQRTWQESLQVLQAGNQRFLKREHGELQHHIRPLHEFEKGQNPYAVVLCCSDARVSADILFDQYIGDLFVIQNAGNVCDDAVLGSIQYAIKYLKTPLVVVLGHSLCGAVTAAHTDKTEKGPLRKIVKKIDEHVIEDGDIEDSTINHAKATAATIRQSLEKLNLLHQEDGFELAVLAAYYDICKGTLCWT